MTMQSFQFLLSFLSIVNVVSTDNNFLTGANDILVVKDEFGEMRASPFSVQFGKKDIWLPRSGHIVKLEVNNVEVPVTMVLDSEGQGYFPTQEKDKRKRQYRFWSALLGFGEPQDKHRTSTATNDQLSQLGLSPGLNSLYYKVTTESGSEVTVGCIIHLINNTRKLIVSDIDGTVTRSNIRGFILPVLGLSDWKHEGVVDLYSRISDQGYQMLYLTNRPIGQSSLTRDYMHSLTNGDRKMPLGPVMLQVESLIGAIQTEVFQEQPEVNKIAALSRIRGLFTQNPFYAGFGNKAWDILAYKALNINPDLIYNVGEDSVLYNEGTGISSNYTQIIKRVPELFPEY